MRTEKWLQMIGCRAADTDAKGLMHRVDYDDPQSLKLKYGYAKQAKALGVGMWTATAINCEVLCNLFGLFVPHLMFSSRAFADTDTKNFGTFWDDLKAFSPPAAATVDA